MTGPSFFFDHETNTSLYIYIYIQLVVCWCMCVCILREILTSKQLLFTSVSCQKQNYSNLFQKCIKAIAILIQN